ncbi:MAG: hypothetical protein AUG08_14440 [Acidobacteria bacterium 13_1_20CM_2_55_15]|nr:MAG: hypothetical protein AUG08_14440 [Acidobacteria bacterium 13_1_20CM_2_55_15]
MLSTQSVVPSTEIVTAVTPTLSLAEAVTVTLPDTVAPFAGAVMLTAGGVVSGGGGGGGGGGELEPGKTVTQVLAASIKP